MSTPNNVFETISPDTLVTATGGTTDDPTRRQLWQLSRSIKDAVASQQTNASASNNTTMLAMVAALAMRNR